MEPLREDDPRSLGGYRVLARLAAGGMGRVYLAVDAERRAVALKVARPEFAADARFRVRFRREVDTARGVGMAGRLRGAAGPADRRGGAMGIAPVVAADPEAELPWLASEYVPGPSVTEAVMGFGPLSAAGLRTLTRGLASALAEVHAAGVVHRDVKPSNVLLARDGPRLIDFGVARALDDAQLTRHGAVIGSPGFLSPEQAVGKSATFGSDVFALASVIVYAARGVGPFGAGEGPALLYRVVHEPPTLAGVPADVTGVLAACLAKDHTERPTAAEIADSVDAAADADADWLPEAVLGDIARREAELAAWIEVAGTPDPLWIRAVAALKDRAAFDTTAETALDVANAELAPPTAEPAIGGARASAAQHAAPAGDDAPPSATYFPIPHAKPAARLAAQHAEPVLSEALRSAAELPTSRSRRPPATHRRPARRSTHRRGFPVYAALGAVLGAAAAAVVLLLPHSSDAAPRPSDGPALAPSSSASAPPTPKTAPPASSGQQSGPQLRRSPASTSASQSPR